MTLKPKVWMACPLCGKQSPMPDPDVREWVGLTQEEIEDSYNADYKAQTRDIEAKLKEKNS
jgi:hypothetical protein